MAILEGLQALQCDFLGDFYGKRCVSLNQKVKALALKHNFEFSSARACQSVIVRSEGSNPQYTLYIKGADNKIVSNLVDQSQASNAQRVSDDFASQGFRTLFYAMRSLSKEEYERIRKQYNQLKQTPDSGQRIQDFLAKEVEVGLTFLGFVVLRDELQKQVGETIQQLRDAGVKIWMVTGDKSQTALSIGKQTMMLHQNQYILMFDKKMPETGQGHGGGKLDL